MQLDFISMRSFCLILLLLCSNISFFIQKFLQLSETWDRNIRHTFNQLFQRLELGLKNDVDPSDVSVYTGTTGKKTIFRSVLSPILFKTGYNNRPRYIFNTVPLQALLYCFFECTKKWTVVKM